jgi:7-carboxy-7-deazaguanine synthase
MNTFLHEIFSGIQGEGPLVGVRQLFARFCGCNLNCRFCDTPASRGCVDTCLTERTSGERDFAEIPNPLSVDTVIDAVTRLTPFPHHSVSITGGEPLVQADVLVKLLPRLRERLPIYLETNGTLVDELAKVVQWCDWVAMDIKLASATGGPDQLAVHRAFLQIAQHAPGTVFVKIVVTADTDNNELRRSFNLVLDVLPEAEVLLQPVTKVKPDNQSNRAITSPTPSQVLKWQEMGLGILKSVRVIPQTHKMIGQM